MSISLMKIFFDQKDEQRLFAWYEIDLCFCRIFWFELDLYFWKVQEAFGKIMTNAYPCSFWRNSHILCQPLDVEHLPCYQDRSSIEECWWQLELVNYDKIETMAQLFACHFSRTIQHYDCLDFRRKILVIFLIWCSFQHSSIPLHNWVLKKKKFVNI